MQAEDLFNILSLLVLLFVANYLCGFNHDYPINDAWSFGLTVKRLAALGGYYPVGWSSMPLVSQVLWGAIFCTPFGFSFQALHISTLFLFYIGVILIYLIIKEISGLRGFAYLSALVFGFNPIIYVLSGSFMTDVPFTAFTIISCAAIIKYFKTLRPEYYVIALFASVMATMDRQLGLAIPMAFLVAGAVKCGFRKRKSYVYSIPLSINIVALFGLKLWLKAIHRLPALYTHASNILINNLFALYHPVVIKHVALDVVQGIVYLGFFMLPVLLYMSGNKEGDKDT